MSHSASPQPVPTALKNTGDALLIEWSDGAVHRLRWHLLRERCPCATCRARRSQPSPALPVLTSEKAQPVQARSVRSVGNYAYAIEFTDGHTTGIYSLELLRQLGEQEGNH